MWIHPSPDLLLWHLSFEARLLHWILAQPPASTVVVWAGFRAERKALRVAQMGLLCARTPEQANRAGEWSTCLGSHSSVCK